MDGKPRDFLWGRHFLIPFNTSKSRMNVRILLGNRGLQIYVIEKKKSFGLFEFHTEGNDCVSLFSPSSPRPGCGHIARVERERGLPAFLAASPGLHLLLRQEDASRSLGKSLQVFQTCRCLPGLQSHLVFYCDCAGDDRDAGESGQNLG